MRKVFILNAVSKVTAQGNGTGHANKVITFRFYFYFLEMEQMKRANPLIR